MSFAQPITQIYHSLFIKNPSGALNYKAYIEPMHYLAWISVILFLFIYTTIFVHESKVCIKFFTLLTLFHPSMGHYGPYMSNPSTITTDLELLTLKFEALFLLMFVRSH